MNENIYFAARKKAAEKDGPVKKPPGRRGGTAGFMRFIDCVLAGNIKNIPVDIVVMMADLYGAPELPVTANIKTNCPDRRGRKEIVYQSRPALKASP